MSERVIVAGGGMSGLKAAEELNKKGYDVLLVDNKRKHVYKPSIPKIINERPVKGLEFDIDNYFRETNVEYTREEIKDIRTNDKVVETTYGDYEYNYLVVALGGEVEEPEFSLSLTENFYSKESAEEAVDALEEAESATIIGSGYLGVEVALRLDSEDIDVSLVDSSTRPLSEESQSVSESVLDLLNQRDISFMAGKKVCSAHGFGVEFEDGGDKESDVVIWCGGIQASRIVQESFNTGKEGIKVNKGLSAVSFDNVYAVGRSADIEGSSRALESIKQGEKAAKNISKKEGILDDYNQSNRYKYICSPDSGILVREESIISGRFVNTLGVIHEIKYRANIWSKQKLRNIEVSMDPILSMMDSEKK